jgi:predicted Zn-dependent protease
VKKILFAVALAAPLILCANTDPSVVADCDRAQKLLNNFAGKRAQLEEARNLIMSVLARDRDYAPAYVALSRLERKAAYQGYDNYSAEGLRRSEKFAAHALKLDPRSSAAYFALASAEMAERDFDRARASIDSAEQLGARPAAVRGARAEIALDESDPKTALRLMKDTLSSKDATADDRAGAYSIMVQIYQAAGAVDDADRAYQELLKLRPDDAWTHGNYADFLLQHDRVDDAIRQAERAVQLMRYPAGLMTLSRAYLAKAEELWDAKDYGRSADYIDRATRMAGDNAELFYYLGVFYERASKRTGDKTLLARAQASYRKALALNPQYSAAQQGLKRVTQ